MAGRKSRRGRRFGPRAPVPGLGPWVCRSHIHSPDAVGRLGGRTCAVPGCHARATVRRGRVTGFEVSGTSASEVQAVSRELVQDVAEQRDAHRVRSPWYSGAFYLSAAAVLIVLLLAVGHWAPWYAVPLVILGAITLLIIIGSLQMRQDGNLSDRGFVRVMGDVLRHVPPVFPQLRGSGSVRESAEQSSEPR